MMKVAVPILESENVKVLDFVPNKMGVLGADICKYVDDDAEEQDYSDDSEPGKEEFSISMADVPMLVFNMEDIDGNSITTQFLFAFSQPEEMIMFMASPLFVRNTPDDVHEAFDLHMTITETHKYGLSDGEFFATGDKSRPYYYRLMVQSADQKIHEICHIHLTQEQFIQMNMYIFNFRSCHWINPMSSIMRRNVFRNSGSLIPIASIIYNGSSVFEGHGVISAFSLYPESPLYKPAGCVVSSGGPIKKKILMNEKPNKEFMDAYGLFAMLSNENTIPIIYTDTDGEKKGGILIIYKNKELLGDLVRLYWLSNDLIDRTHFGEWEKMFYMGIV